MEKEKKKDEKKFRIKIRDLSPEELEGVDGGIASPGPQVGDTGGTIMCCW